MNERICLELDLKGASKIGDLHGVEELRGTGCSKMLKILPASESSSYSS